MPTTPLGIEYPVTTDATRLAYYYEREAVTADAAVAATNARVTTLEGKVQPSLTAMNVRPSDSSTAAANVFVGAASVGMSATSTLDVFDVSGGIVVSGTANQVSVIRLVIDTTNYDYAVTLTANAVVAFPTMGQVLINPTVGAHTFAVQVNGTTGVVGKAGCWVKVIRSR